MLKSRYDRDSSNFQRDKWLFSGFWSFHIHVRNCISCSSGSSLEYDNLFFRLVNLFWFLSIGENLCLPFSLQDKCFFYASTLQATTFTGTCIFLVFLVCCVAALCVFHFTFRRFTISQLGLVLIARCWNINECLQELKPMEYALPLDDRWHYYLSRIALLGGIPGKIGFNSYIVFSQLTLVIFLFGFTNQFAI